MAKTSKIAISLPEGLLQSIEKERQARGESRSEFFRRAAENLLRELRELELDRQYIQGYQKYPETKEELALAESTMLYAFAANPWEEDDTE